MYTCMNLVPAYGDSECSERLDANALSRRIDTAIGVPGGEQTRGVQEFLASNRRGGSTRLSLWPMLSPIMAVAFFWWCADAWWWSIQMALLILLRTCVYSALLCSFSYAFASEALNKGDAAERAQMFAWVWWHRYDCSMGYKTLFDIENIQCMLRVHYYENVFLPFGDDHVHSQRVHGRVFESEQSCLDQRRSTMIWSSTLLDLCKWILYLHLCLYVDMQQVWKIIYTAALKAVTPVLHKWHLIWEHWNLIFRFLLCLIASSLKDSQRAR